MSPGRCWSSGLLMGVMGAAAEEAASSMFSLPDSLLLAPGPLSAAPLASLQPGLGGVPNAAHALRAAFAASAAARFGNAGVAGTESMCCAVLACALSGAADSVLFGCSAAVAAAATPAPPLRARNWACTQQ